MPTHGQARASWRRWRQDRWSELQWPWPGFDRRARGVKGEFGASAGKSRQSPVQPARRGQSHAPVPAPGQSKGGAALGPIEGPRDRADARQSPAAVQGGKAGPPVGDIWTERMQQQVPGHAPSSLRKYPRRRSLSRSRSGEGEARVLRRSRAALLSQKPASAPPCQARARFENRVKRPSKASSTVPIGPWRCLPMMTSALPCTCSITACHCAIFSSS